MITKKTKSVLLFATFFSLSLDYMQYYGISISDLLILLVTIVSMADISLRKRVTRVGVCALLLFSGLLLSLTISKKGLYNSYSLVIAKSVFLSLSSLYLINSKKVLFYSLKGLALGGLLVIITSLLQVLGGFSMEFFRDIKIYHSRLQMVGLPFRLPRGTGIVPTHGNYGIYSTFSVLVSISFVCLRLNTRWTVRWILVYAIAISVPLLMSQSRSLLLASVLAIITVTLVTSLASRGNLQMVVYFSLALTISALLYTIIEDIMYVDISTVENRIYIYGVAIKEWKDASFLGLGLGNFKETIGTRHIVHSTFVTALTFGGLVAFSLLSILYLWPACTLLSRSNSDILGNPLVAGIFGSYVALITESLFYNGLGNPLTYVLPVLVLKCVYIMDESV